VKQLGLVIGVDVYAVKTTVSAFFAGLAFGGAFFGRRAERTARPWLMVTCLEIGIAVLGLGGTLALSRSPQAFVALKTVVGLLSWALPFVSIGLPAFLMSADPSLKDDVALARQKLWTLYRAGYYVYTGQAGRWESMIKRLLPEIRDNPYFRWFVTDKR
jgi:MFS family permease